MKRHVLILTLLLISMVCGVSILLCAAEGILTVPIGSPISYRSIDGNIGLEYNDAEFIDVELIAEDGSIFPAILFVKHDVEYLYIGMQTSIGLPLGDLEAFIAFDSNGNGLLFDRGDDIADLLVEMSQGRPVTQDVDFLYPTAFEFHFDTDFGGFDDVVAAATLQDGVFTAEFKRPLDSGDLLGNDPCLNLDDEILIGIGFYGVGPEIEARWDGWISISSQFAGMCWWDGGVQNVPPAVNRTAPKGAERIKVTNLGTGDLKIYRNNKLVHTINRTGGHINMAVKPGDKVTIDSDSESRAAWRWGAKSR